MNWLRDRWPYLTYTAGIFVALAALFIWVVPAAADAPSIAVHFISAREGYRSEPYLDSAGCITVGYGELLTCTADARLADYSAVTEAEAEAFLRQRVEEIIRRVDAEVTVELHDEQMAALVSFVYNLGQSAFANSTLLQMIDDGAPVGEIAREWLSWDHIHVDGVAQASRGLSRRRLAELGLYFFGTSER